MSGLEGRKERGSVTEEIRENLNRMAGDRKDREKVNINKTWGRTLRIGV